MSAVTSIGLLSMLQFRDGGILQMHAICIEKDQQFQRKAKRKTKQNMISNVPAPCFPPASLILPPNKQNKKKQLTLFNCYSACLLGALPN